MTSLRAVWAYSCEEQKTQARETAVQVSSKIRWEAPRISTYLPSLSWYFLLKCFNQNRANRLSRPVWETRNTSLRNRTTSTLQICSVNYYEKFSTLQDARCFENLQTTVTLKASRPKSSKFTNIFSDSESLSRSRGTIIIRFVLLVFVRSWGRGGVQAQRGQFEQHWYNDWINSVFSGILYRTSLYAEGEQNEKHVSNGTGRVHRVKKMVKKLADNKTRKK